MCETRQGCYISAGYLVWLCTDGQQTATGRRESLSGLRKTLPRHRPVRSEPGRKNEPAESTITAIRLWVLLSISVGAALFGVTPDGLEKRRTLWVQSTFFVFQPLASLEAHPAVHRSGKQPVAMRSRYAATAHGPNEQASGVRFHRRPRCPVRCLRGC